MAKITKAEFIRRLKSGEHCLYFVSRKPIKMDEVELECIEANRLDTRPEAWRSVKETHSNHLVFTDDSRLYFDGYATRTYHDLGHGLLCVAVTERGNDYTKYLYYEMRREK